MQLLELRLSLLNAPERLAVCSEAELVARLRPGEDGLILRLGALRATFLPEVWQALPSPVEFIRALQRKAGIPPGLWSDQLEAFRYSTTSIRGGPAVAQRSGSQLRSATWILGGD